MIAEQFIKLTNQLQLPRIYSWHIYALPGKVIAALRAVNCKFANLRKSDLFADSKEGRGNLFAWQIEWHHEMHKQLDKQTNK